MVVPHMLLPSRNKHMKPIQDGLTVAPEPNAEEGRTEGQRKEARKEVRKEARK